MLKIVPDTNILVSSTIANGNEFQILKLAKDRKIQLIISPQILSEFKGVISRAKFGFSKNQISDVLKQILSVCTLISPNITIDVISKDPTDNRILECAKAAKANYIISGDNHLLELKKFEMIIIFSAGDFLRSRKPI